MRRGAKAEGPVGDGGWWEGLMRVRKIAETMKIRMEDDSSCWIEVQETDKTAGEKDEIISGRYGCMFRRWCFGAWGNRTTLTRISRIQPPNEKLSSRAFASLSTFP